MSKFEPKSIEHCYKNCKWLTSDYVVATFPAQARCEKFEVLVSLDRTTCIEDEGSTNCYPNKPESLVLNPNNIIKEIIKERENTLEKRAKKIEEKLANLDNNLATFVGEKEELRDNQIEIRKRLEALENKKVCHDEAEEGDVFRCSACHYQEPSLGGWNYCPNCGRKVEEAE